VHDPPDVDRAFHLEPIKIVHRLERFLRQRETFF
jgi:hypothetical protein